MLRTQSYRGDREEKRCLQYCWAGDLIVVSEQGLEEAQGRAWSQSKMVHWGISRQGSHAEGSVWLKSPNLLLSGSTFDWGQRKGHHPLELERSWPQIQGLFRDSTWTIKPRTLWVLRDGRGSFLDPPSPLVRPEVLIELLALAPLLGLPVIKDMFVWVPKYQGKLPSSNESMG